MRSRKKDGVMAVNEMMSTISIHHLYPIIAFQRLKKTKTEILYT
jgi:hypothetical protein